MDKSVWENTDTQTDAAETHSADDITENLEPDVTDTGQRSEAEATGTMVSDTVSTTAMEGRKSSKPVMEKRRRARINACLAELKSLLMDVIKAEGTRHSKMEKADILEMTVRYLRQLQRHHSTGSRGGDLATGNKYRLGYNECINEVGRFLTSLETDDVDLKSRILAHLANCSTGSTLLETDSKPCGNLLPINTALVRPRVEGTEAKLEQVAGDRTSRTLAVTEQVHTVRRPVNKEHSHTYQTLLPKDTTLSQNATVPSTATVAIGDLHSNRLPIQLLPRETVTSAHALPMTSSLPIVTGSFQTGSVQNVCLQPSVSSAISLTSQITPTAMLGGLQLIPTKLTTGELAFVLPTNVTSVVPSAHAPSYVIPVYTPSMVQGTCNNTVTNVAISGQTVPVSTEHPVNVSLTPGSSGVGTSQNVTTPQAAAGSQIETGKGVHLDSGHHSRNNRDETFTPSPRRQVVSFQQAGRAARSQHPEPAEEEDEDVWRPW